MVGLLVLEDPHALSSLSEAAFFIDEPIELEETRGILQYTPSPDIGICFCGSYYLVADDGFEDYYLVSDVIELSKHVGEKIRVQGRAFQAPCEGTLFRLCDFLIVDSVEELIETGTHASSWGRIKALFE